MGKIAVHIDCSRKKTNNRTQLKYCTETTDTEDSVEPRTFDPQDKLIWGEQYFGGE